MSNIKHFLDGIKKNKKNWKLLCDQIFFNFSLLSRVLDVYIVLS